MHNIKRSVERIKGVDKVEFDINTGRGDVWVEPGTTIAPAAIWDALTDSGFTLVRIEARGKVYKGPK